MIRSQVKYYGVSSAIRLLQLLKSGYMPLNEGRVPAGMRPFSIATDRETNERLTALLQATPWSVQYIA